MIRAASREDLPSIEKVYEKARQYMRDNGNPDQWGERYPQEEILCEDLRNHALYVLSEEDGRIYGVFMFAVTEDPTYAVIEKGEWRNDGTYGVIHRVASDGTHHGVMREVVSHCVEKIAHLRMDTHRSNRTMQHQILKNGFQYCGIIHVRDGSERLAYERLPEENDGEQ